jgi:hypothetical protein
MIILILEVIIPSSQRNLTVSTLPRRQQLCDAKEQVCGLPCAPYLATVAIGDGKHKTSNGDKERGQRCGTLQRCNPDQPCPAWGRGYLMRPNRNQNVLVGRRPTWQETGSSRTKAQQGPYRAASYGQPPNPNSTRQITVNMVNSRVSS